MKFWGSENFKIYPIFKFIDLFWLISKKVSQMEN